MKRGWKAEMILLGPYFLFIGITTILWAADISAVKDEAGLLITSNTLKTVNSGMTVYAPLIFSCRNNHFNLLWMPLAN